MQPTFFATPAEFRAWLEEHHVTATELLVGFYKTKSGTQSMTWPESVDEALCFGWIDGRGKRIDDARHSIRFTPRRRGSIWSVVNIQKVADLTNQGRMRPAGLKAFAERSEERSGVYSHEQKDGVAFDNVMEQQFRANEKAWDFFQARAASYRKAATWWVVSAKREETRAKRLATLIDDSENGCAVRHLTRTPKPANVDGSER